jgi:hypothetical protein
MQQEAEAEAEAEGKLADVRRRCHKRQRGNLPRQMIGEWEVELLAQHEVAVRQDEAESLVYYFPLWCSLAGKMN